uniref:PET domain-containing protein n=1 Tax=Panagrolaimus sp. ES5 TaxID=591445 RepID=A0AC34F936_9BILA
MAMIATVHPYNRKNSGFKIEDVTDDPKYQNNDEGELEGALVEYCRIDSRNYKPQHSVCEASTVVSARGNNNNDKHSFSTGIPAPPTSWKSSTVANQHQMAHIIDVEVGQPCSAMAQCKCFGFRPHPWRKVCVHCKCDRTEHEIGPNQVLNVYERLGIKPTPDMAAVMKNQRSDTPGSISFGYAWVPPGLNRVRVEEYMSQLPNHVIPRINSLGEKYREKQLMLQLPRQDLSIAYCKNLKTPVERRIYEEFVNARNEIALDIGYVSSNLPKSMVTPFYTQ